MQLKCVTQRGLIRKENASTKNKKLFSFDSKFVEKNLPGDSGSGPE
jgi:hypothetical protein